MEWKGEVFQNMWTLGGVEGRGACGHLVEWKGEVYQNVWALGGVEWRGVSECGHYA